MPGVRLVPDLVLTPDGWRRDSAVVVADGRVVSVDAVGAARPDDVDLRHRALLVGGDDGLPLAEVVERYTREALFLPDHDR